MSEEKPSLIAISDIFGAGKIAHSPAATRLIDAIIAGVGELSYPWRVRRNSQAQIEVAKQVSAEVPSDLNVAVDLDQRVQMRLVSSDRRHQINREAIAEKAIEDLKHVEPQSIDETLDKEMEADWVEYFWKKAETVSDSDMQGLWSRILSRKAAGHNISLRTLDLLRTLSAEEAKIIETLSQYKVAIGPDHPYWRNSVGLVFSPEVRLEGDEREAPENITVHGKHVVSEDGVAVDSRCRDLIGNHFPNVLGPIGIYSDAHRIHRFALNWTKEPLPVQIGEQHFFIEGLPGGDNKGHGLVEFGTGVGFSQIGWEVFSLAKVDTNPKFVELFRATLERRNLNLVPRSLTGK